MLKLRPAIPEDASLILQYIRELAEYERDPEAAVATEADIHRWSFDESWIRADGTVDLESLCL